MKSIAFIAQWTNVQLHSIVLQTMITCNPNVARLDLLRNKFGLVRALAILDACEQHLFSLLLRSLLTHGAGSTIFQGLGVKLGHLYLLLKQFVELLLLILILVCQFR